jgi:hypothetical protein
MRLVMVEEHGYRVLRVCGKGTSVRGGRKLSSEFLAEVLLLRSGAMLLS